MTVLDLDADDLSRPPAPEVAPVVDIPPAKSATHLTKAPEAWGWSEFRDYVMSEIEQREGPQVRNLIKEASIFKGFLKRWGIETAVAIAKFAFEFCDGMWRGAPISITRFCAGSDPYFGQPIADRLADAA